MVQNDATRRGRLLDQGMAAADAGCSADPQSWPPAISAAAGVLVELLHEAAARAKPSEHMENVSYAPCFGGVSVEAKGARTGATYELSVTLTEGLCLGCQLPNLSLLNRVTDGFWAHLIEICRLPGKARFADNVCATSGLDAEAGRHLRSRSVLFQLIRNFVLLASDPESMGDLGRIEYRLGSTRIGSEALDEVAGAFRHLYAMSYELYRLQYLAAHSGNSRH